jgi:lysozyme family protein
VATLTKKLANEYGRLYESCRVRPSRRAEVDRLVRQLSGHRPRYETVAKALGTPWYVVGAVHALEAGMDFSRHLHNGDPLTARTTHVPAGRPKTGKPPFTWEQSAIDALTLKNFATWRDWSVPGILYKLEDYNGWGYRDKHPQVLSPYLWSFSNHYNAGKYVADGRFSATAVSAQCGVAVLLKGLHENGKAAVEAGPRAIGLTTPPTTGPDVKEAQRLLRKSEFGSFAPGPADGEYGEHTAAATRRAKWELGYPEGAVDTSFGPRLRAFLAGKEPLPSAFRERRAKRLRQARPRPG